MNIFKPSASSYSPTLNDEPNVSSPFKPSKNLNRSRSSSLSLPFTGRGRRHSQPEPGSTHGLKGLNGEFIRARQQNATKIVNIIARSKKSFKEEEDKESFEAILPNSPFDDPRSRGGERSFGEDDSRANSGFTTGRRSSDNPFEGANGRGVQLIEAREKSKRLEEEEAQCSERLMTIREALKIVREEIRVLEGGRERLASFEEPKEKESKAAAMKRRLSSFGGKKD